MKKNIYAIFLMVLVLCTSCTDDNSDEFVPSLVGTTWNHQGWCKIRFNSSEYKISLYSFGSSGTTEIFSKQGKYDYKYPDIKLKHKNKDISCKIISDEDMIVQFDENDPVQKYLKGTTELSLIKE